jgi:glycosyltransferase involved in cell wall biosynthesis
MPTVVHLTASTFFGGPERQMLGLAEVLPSEYRTVFISFAEGGRCGAFLDQVGRQGFEAVALEHDTPYFRLALCDLESHLGRVGADVLCCHGYKANLLGRVAARRRGLPVVAVSRGWTGADFKLRVYELLDRLGLRWMDRVVCVSEGQAAKVRRAGVPNRRVLVIRNAIRRDRFDHVDPSYRERLGSYFPEPRGRIIGAAGRLSPEKGFGNLIRAAVTVTRTDPTVGFVLFGEGPLRTKLATQIANANLAGKFVLAGFRSDLDGFLPFLDLMVLPSYNEGLPNVVLEGFAAGVPVVATAVGGTPEVLEDGVSGYLVPPGNVAVLTARILDVLRSDGGGKAMGLRGRLRVRREFSFQAQGVQYQRFFDFLLERAARRAARRRGRLFQKTG